MSSDALTLFISYRRSDSGGSTGRLYDLLESDQRFEVLVDVDSIELGKDFRVEISNQIESSDTVLAVIGTTWTSATDPTSGQRRLDDPRDPVRIEIASALAMGKRLIPILVDGASVPSESELPDEIAQLAAHNGIQVRHESFKRDVRRLADGLARSLKEAPTPTTPASIVAEPPIAAIASPARTGRTAVAPTPVTHGRAQVRNVASPPSRSQRPPSVVRANAQAKSRGTSTNTNWLTPAPWIQWLRQWWSSQSPKRQWVMVIGGLLVGAMVMIPTVSSSPPKYEYSQSDTSTPVTEYEQFDVQLGTGTKAMRNTTNGVIVGLVTLSDYQLGDVLRSADSKKHVLGVLDSKNPYSPNLNGPKQPTTGLSACLNRGFTGMREGGVRHLICPSSLAFGSKGDPKLGIGPDEAVAADIALCMVASPGPITARSMNPCKGVEQP